MGWFRQQLTPRQREKDLAIEVEEAKKHLREAGAANVFEDGEKSFFGESQNEMAIQEVGTKASHVLPTRALAVMAHILMS